MSWEPDVPGFDTHALLARLRAGDDAEITRAYRMTFGGPVGRFVLAHILSRAGVGSIRGPDLKAGTRDYHDGRADCALQIMLDAGFDQHSAAVMTITETLEGRDDERSSQPRTDTHADADPHAYAEPDPEF